MKKKNYSIWGIIIVICISLEILHFISASMLSNKGLYFRLVVDQGMFLNRIIICVTIVGSIINSIFKSTDSEVSKMISSFFVVGISLFIMFYLFMPYALDGAMEGETYIDSKRYIVISRSYGMHHTNLYYYEYVNEILMKRSDKESEMIDGNYNPYANY